MKKGWKIVYSHSNGLLGSVVRSIPSEGGIYYTPGEPTVPLDHCGPLCVYASRGAAAEGVASYSHMSSVRIYECEYEPSTEERVWCGGHGYRSEHTLSWVEWACPGTVLADSVTLGKCVYRGRRWGEVEEEIENGKEEEV